MDDLIKALQILQKYCEKTSWPTACEHDVLYVPCVDESTVPVEDIKELEQLGFHINEENGGFYSTKFGSC